MKRLKILGTNTVLFFPAFLIAAFPTQAMQIDWQNNMLTIAAPQIPGGKLEIWYLEAFCRSRAHDRDWKETVLPHKTTLLQNEAEGKHIRLESRVEPGIQVLHDIRAGSDEVEFQVKLTNPTDRAVDIEWAQPCIRVDKFTGLGQEDYIKRCFIFTSNGLVTLDRTKRTEEARYRGGQVYVPSGIDPRDVNPRPISPDVPANGLIGCFSADGKHLLATAWEPTEELFQGVIVCIHSDFRIGGLKPGETKTAYGKLYLLPNDVDELLKRYHRDFPRH